MFDADHRWIIIMVKLEDDVELDLRKYLYNAYVLPTLVSGG